MENFDLPLMVDAVLSSKLPNLREVMGKVREDEAHTLKLNLDRVALNLEKDILSLIERMENICHELWHLRVDEFSYQEEEDFETVFDELRR